MSRKIRVRFAPSPTGPLHIGGLRTALYNYLFAKKNDGTFILRIEDTDQTRYVPGTEEYIERSLKWCNLAYDEGGTKGGDFGPYRQSERKDIYKQHIQKLVEAGHAYYAFDTPAELEQMRERLKEEGSSSQQYDANTRMQMKNSFTLPEEEVEDKLKKGDPHVIRINIPGDGEVVLDDLIRGTVKWDCAQLDDKVLLKTDGLPTYHLANVVDDHLMQISHIIRGEEWLPSAPVHVLLYRYFGWEDEMPAMAHLPLILRPDGKGKLSKRDGDRLGYPVFPLDWIDPNSEEHASGFKELGFFPEAFVNMLVFLGWNPGTEQEIFTLDELVKIFSLERVGKGGAKFDLEKAKWFNQEHIKLMDNTALAGLVRPLLNDEGANVDQDLLESICGLLKERVEFINDFSEMGNYFFIENYDQDESIIQKKWNGEIKKTFLTLKEQLIQLEDFAPDKIEHIVKDIIEEQQLKFGDVLPLFRVMLTGQKMGPSLFDIAGIIGKDKCIQRMGASFTHFDTIHQ